MLACRNGHTDAAKTLLDGHGVDVNARNSNSWTPLMHACRYGHTDAAKALLDGHGVDVHARNSDSWTPLMLACRYGHTDAAKALLDGHGVDVNACNSNSWTPLMLACRNGHTDAAKTLLDGHGVDVNAAHTPDSWTPLIYACRYGYTDATKLLLDHGADVNARNSDSWTPLMLACRFGYTGAAKLLLAHGAAVDARTSDSLTALMYACRNGHTDAAKLLLDYGADVDAHTSGNGWTPLMNACRAGHIDAAKVLLDHGADVNAHDINFTTPLMIACLYGHPDTTKVLLDHGANWLVVDTDGMWSLRCTTGVIRLSRSGARTGVHPECAKAIVTHPSVSSATDMDNPLIYAAIVGDAKTVQFLLSLRLLDVNFVNKKGFSALFCGAGSRSKKRSRDMCQYLLDKGSAVDGSDPRGVPLLAAARLGNIEAMELLLKRGADANRRDRLLNRTALFFAAQADGILSVNYLESACAARSEGQLLLDAWWAEHVGQKDNRERTPLWYAAAAGNGRQATVQLLLEKGLDRFEKDILGRSILEIVLHDNAELRKLLVEGLPREGDNAESVQDSGNRNGTEALPTRVLLQEPTIDMDELKKLEGCRQYRYTTSIWGRTICSECSESYLTGYFWRE